MQGSAFQRACSRMWVFPVALGTLVASSAARSQPSSMLSGVVADAAGNPLFGARISLRGMSREATSNERGEFRLAGVMIGQVEVQARRLGFGPVVQQVAVGPQESLNRANFTLSALPNTISPVVVQAKRARYTGRLAGYYERLQRRSGGYFVGREELDRKNFRNLSQVLSQTPGVRSQRTRSGAGVVRMRGGNCRPLVWLDGVPMPAGEVDLDVYSIGTLHGIELYLGASSAPIEYTAPMGVSNCGTILLWSRGRDTEPARGKNRSAVDLEPMVAALSVFTSDQVDKTAIPVAARPPAVIYPPALVASGTGGSVVAEFVVDAAGNIEPGTVAIISSTHPLFSDAARESLQGVQYSPASKNGNPVRQIVYQTFAFAPGGHPRK